MTQYCVIKFNDESLCRIAPTEIIRNGDKKKFKPRSARDLPDCQVQVKWQKSSHGSFASDGYYAAHVLAIAGSVRTAEAKAAELKLRLFPKALLPVLPSSTSDKSPDLKKRRRKAESDKNEGRNDQREKSRKERSEGRKLKEEKSTTKKSAKRASKEVSGSDNHGGSKKRIKMDKVSLERTAALTKLALATNPLLKSSAEEMGAQELFNNSDDCKLVADSRTKKCFGNTSEEKGVSCEFERYASKSDIKDGEIHDKEIDEGAVTINVSGEHERDVKKFGDFETNKSDSADEETGECSGEDSDSREGRRDSKIFGRNTDESDSSGEEERGVKRSGEGSGEDSDSEEDGENRPDVKKCERDTTKDNGSGDTGRNGNKFGKALCEDNDCGEDRGKMKEFGGGTDSDPGEDVNSLNRFSGGKGPEDEKFKSRRNSFGSLDETLEIRNLDDEIKDLDVPSTTENSSDSESGSSESSEDKTSKICSSNEALKKEVKSMRESLDECKRNLTVANNMRIAHRDENLKLKAALSKKTEEVALLIKRNSMLQDILSNKFSGTHSRSELKALEVESEELVFEDEATRKKDQKKRKLEYKELQRGTDTLPVSTPNSKSNSFQVCDISLSPVLKSEASDEGNNSHNSGGKKKKTGDDFVKNPEIGIVCDKVLKHLKREKTLVPDERGFINLGIDVKVDKHAMEKSLKDYKGDVLKLSKAMAGLTWTSSQREERSLEGGKNNRYPNAPSKKAATPKKVNACLGVVKAHLLHQGDSDGPGMLQNLKTGRKAIGARFAQDYAQAKKRAGNN